jgi:hypothetical protein
MRRFTSKIKTIGSKNQVELKYPCLVRDFISDRLYAANEGYFQKENHQVGELEPIQYQNLLGYHAYRTELQSKYPKHAWITPSELFKPYYGYMIANYIIETWHKEYK